MTKSFVAASLAVAVVVTGLIGLRVMAFDNPLTDTQIQQISGSCLSTKNTLSQLHASDALLRVNRGQLYESMYTRLMDRFNNRAASNNINNDGLITVTKSYTAALDLFRTDYKSYEEQLAKSIKIDCAKQPVLFYGSVTLARTKRQQVNADIKSLNQYIDQYQSATAQFEKDFVASQEVKG